MNCAITFLEHAKKNPKQLALWLPRTGALSFGELREIAARAQKLCMRNGVGPGDHVLLFDGLGPNLYGAVIGIMTMGASVVLVEPWLPIEKINHVIQVVKPKLYLSSWLGRVWGIRSRAIRDIRAWVGISSIASEASGEIHVESVPEDAHGIVTFTSGTTSNPKGVVRNQGYLVNLHRVFSKALELEAYRAPDLCIFANFALANLASGRGSVLLSLDSKPGVLRSLEHLPLELRPETMTCGPAFLRKLMREARVPSLKAIHVGGALTDCAIFEKGFKHWPGAHWTHVYGSSEAEPVALADARVAVAESRKRGYFQTLQLGTPIPAIRANLEKDGVWVAGPHVCPRYLGNEEENRLHKRTDTDGTVWHFMGDRVLADSGQGSWWYAGRSGQPHEHFELEQKIYSFLESSKSFIHVQNGRLILVGEDILSRAQELRKKFPQVSEVVESKIKRDRRHRARIDRNASLKGKS